MEGLGVTMRLPDAAFWNGKRVLLTGHTGFKGAWTALWLSAMGADVYGLALPAANGPTLFNLAKVDQDIKSRIQDIRDAGGLRDAIKWARPEIVIHMAAQALVSRSVAHPLETFDTNINGTANLLEALKDCSTTKAILVVTSDKVYANAGTGARFKECGALGGHDPYSASKAACEIVTASFRETYFTQCGVAVATARAGNVIGGGDFSKDRIVPDCVRSAQSGETLILRHPEATRPWQHVLDCIGGYLLYAEDLSLGKQVPLAVNFGPKHQDFANVQDLTDAMLRAFGNTAQWEHRPVPVSVEAKALALDSSLARQSLGWHERFEGHAIIRETARWYKAYFQGQDMRRFSLDNLAEYMESVHA